MGGRRERCFSLLFRTDHLFCYVLFMDNLVCVGIAADWFYFYRHAMHAIAKKVDEWKVRWKDKFEQFRQNRVYQWCCNQEPALKKFLGGGVLVILSVQRKSAISIVLYFVIHSNYSRKMCNP